MLKTLVRGKEFYLYLFFISLITCFTFYDILMDLNQGVGFRHVIHEACIFIFSVCLIFFQLRTNVRKSKQIYQMQDELIKFNQEREAFHRKIAGSAQAFAQAVEKQLNDWQLTASEKDIAILLIKGLSMREIAEARISQESTVRQQATSIYKKSKCENRQQLSAFFLEDLF